MAFEPLSEKRFRLIRLWIAGVCGKPALSTTASAAEPVGLRISIEPVVLPLENIRMPVVSVPPQPLPSIVLFSTVWPPRLT